MPTTAELATQLEALSVRISQSELSNADLKKDNAELKKSNAELRLENTDLKSRLSKLESEYSNRFTGPSTFESTLSTLAAIHTDQQVILKDVLIQTNTITALLTSPPDHSTSPKPPSTSDSQSNVLHSLIFPGPTIKSDHFKEIIEVFQQLKKLQQKTKNTSDRFIFDYFMHHAPDVFQSLLSKFRILYSDPTFQFKPPDSQFIGDTHLALFPHPTTNTLHQLLLAWRPHKEDYAQMPTFLFAFCSAHYLNFFKNFAPLSTLDTIRSVLSPALQTAIDV